MTRKFERLIFHAGMPKTGTTIIQYTLKRGAPTNADLLDLGPSNQTGACRLLFDEQKKEAKYKAHRRNKPNAGLEKAGLLERLHRQFDTSCQPALILSAEWGYRAKPESLMRLKALFQPHCERIEVYIYLRRPEAFMNSVFQQRIKGSGEGFLPPWPKYREMCLKHERIFGADQVNLRVYDRDRFPKGDVVADFFDWTGLDGMQSMTLERNKSLSAAGVALMGCYRRHKPQAGIASGDPEVKWLVNRLRALKAPKLALSLDLYRFDAAPVSRLGDLCFEG